MKLKDVRDHFLRIDARSLGLFRIAMGLVLVVDLLSRFRLITAFYSNEGVLPNHNHLFNLRETGRVWSLFHSFSSPGEMTFAFLVTLGIYVAFTLGFKTRAMHVVSLLLLVSLTARNTLTENAGNYFAIAALMFTAFSPSAAGSRSTRWSRRSAPRSRSTPPT